VVNTGNPNQGKRLIIGLDEAGYGPNLGPLLVAGSAWLVPEGLTETDFLEAFHKTFSAKGWSPGCPQIPLGDSKKLYQSGGGLQSLEAGLLALLHTVGSLPSRPKPSGPFASNLAELLRYVTDTPVESSLQLDQELPWYQDLSSFSVPGCPELSEGVISRLATEAASALANRGIQLVAIRASMVTEPEFNRRVLQMGSKGHLLSEATLDLASQLLRDFPETPIEIYCDRQGGRKNYLPLLLEWMPDRWFIETERNAIRCSYRTSQEPTVQIHFTVRGDSFPATALASMAAKYLRERLMESFNAYWKNKCHGLKPTAGYPADAKRFRTEILPTANRLSLDERLWWRCR